MKLALFALILAAAPSAFADNGTDSTKPVDAKTPPETVKVTDEAAQGLFDRVRGAHLRAVQRGQLAANKT